MSGGAPLSLLAGSRADGRHRNDGLGLGRHVRVDREQSVSLQPGHRQVLGIAQCVPVLLTRDLPRRCARRLRGGGVCRGDRGAGIDAARGDEPDCRKKLR